MFFNLFRRTKKTREALQPLPPGSFELVDVPAEPIPAIVTVAPPALTVSEGPASTPATERPVPASAAPTSPVVKAAAKEIKVPDGPVTTTPTGDTPAVNAPTAANTVAELRAHAKTLGLTGYSRMTKAQLLSAIADRSQVDA